MITFNKLIPGLLQNKKLYFTLRYLIALLIVGFKGPYEKDSPKINVVFKKEDTKE